MTVEGSARRTTAQVAARVADRRFHERGDRRRGRLLQAVSELLHEKPFAEISIGEISERAGVTRSAFYFYFENKAVAVAAVMINLYDETLAASSSMLEARGAPYQRFEEQLRDMVRIWDDHAVEYRAMLDARATDPQVQELWDVYRVSVVPAIAEMIDAERVRGRAPAGVDSVALATVLLELNDLMLQRLALGDPLPLEDRIAVMTSLWVAAIYGIAGRGPT